MRLVLPLGYPRCKSAKGGGSELDLLRRKRGTRLCFIQRCQLNLITVSVVWCGLTRRAFDGQPRYGLAL